MPVFTNLSLPLYNAIQLKADGGSGSGIVSKHASQHLPSLLTQSLTSSALNPESYESAIKSAISSEEEQIVQAFKDGEEEYAFAGSTLALVLLDLKSGTLFTGNMGDSKVFLGTLDSGDQVEDVVCCYTLRIYI